MSIQPVPTLGPSSDPVIGGTQVRGDASAPSKTPSAQPDSGTKSRSENPTLELSKDSTPIPQDEVQVQRVNGAGGDIVIRYLDASGNLILQIPSAQVLGLARAVEQALEQQANRRTGASENPLPA